MVADFHWVIDGRLAGSAKPGLLNSREDDLRALHAMGIRTIVDLTEVRPDPLPDEFGFQLLHFPISDMGIPTPRAAAAFCGGVVDAIERNEPVLLHCRAGKGRTGTMLACCLVTLGRAPDEALAEVRRANRHYVETDVQEQFIAHYAEYIRSRRMPKEAPDSAAPPR